MKTSIISFYRINFNLYHYNSFRVNSFRVNESLRNLYKISRIPRTCIYPQKTFFSTNIRDITNNSNNVETKQLIFEGPNFRLIRILKLFSISTFGVRIRRSKSYSIVHI
jgi:hypothetical protein